MPSGLHSTHICRTIINSAALLEEEKPSAGVGCVADMEAVAMKAPLLAFRWGWAALPISHVARVLIANILSHSARPRSTRSEEHTSELQSLMRISYAVFCLKKKR